MAGKPWEIYQRAGLAPKETPKPWERYQQTQEPIDYDAAVVDERHPDVSVADRAIVKNFSNSPDSAIAFLTKKYPGYEVKADPDGIAIRKQGEEFYKRLDPSSIELEDLSDVGTDVTSGVASTAGTALGAGVGLSAGPAGVIPGAMVGSGAAGAGHEALRQKLGQYMGLPQEVNTSDVVTSGLVSAASPLVFGAAPLKSSATNYVAKQMSKPGQTLTKEAVQDLIDAGGTGVLKRAYNTATRKVAPWLGETVSGVPKQAIKTYANNREEINALSKDGVTDLVESAQQRLSSGIGKIKASKGKALGDAIDSAGGKVNIGAVKGQYQAYINELKQKASSYPDGAPQWIDDQLNAAQKEYQYLFGIPRSDPKVVGSYTVPGDEGFQGQRINAGSYDTPAQTISSRVYDKATGTWTNVDESLPGASVGIAEDTALRTNPKTGELERMANRPSTPDATINIVDDPNVKFDWNTMKSASRASEIPDQLTAQQAFDLQHKLRDSGNLTRMTGGPAPRHSTAATSDEKALADTALEGYRSVNQELDRVTEGLTGELKKDYKTYAELQKTLQPYFRTPQSTMNTLSGLDKNSRRILFEKLKELSEKDGINLLDDAKTLEALRYFRDPGLDAISGGGTTSTSRTIPLATLGGSLGALLGYKMGGGFAGATAGGATGAFLGSKAGSPKAIKGIIDSGAWAEKLGRELQPKGNFTPGAAKSSWEMLKRKDTKKTQEEE